MTTLYEGAFAKLNLTLDVLGKREDGYHDLKSVMQTISIRDDIEIDVGTGKPWRISPPMSGIWPGRPQKSSAIPLRRTPTVWKSGLPSGFPPAPVWAAAAPMRQRFSGH